MSTHKSGFQKRKEKETKIRKALKGNRSLLDIGFQKIKSNENTEASHSTVEC